jgi:hypothetical protein
MTNFLSNALQRSLVMIFAVGLLFSCSQMDTFETPDAGLENLEKFKVVAKGSVEANEWARTAFDFCGTEKTVQLIAGQHTVVGEVSAYNDKDKLYITITTDGSWYIRKTHLYTGERSQTDGIKNPAPGRFPYSYDATSLNNYGVQEYTYEVDAEGLKGWGEFDIAIHADVVQVAVNPDGSPKLDINGNATIMRSEGAWGQGSRFTLKGSWAMFFTYSLQDCIDICTGTWFRKVSGASNGTQQVNFDFEESVESEEYELFDGPTLVARASVRRNRSGSPTTVQAIRITVQFSIMEEGYTFEEFGSVFRTTSITDELNREFFTGNIFTDPLGKEILYTDEGTREKPFHLALYAKVTGVCKIN